LSLLVGNRQRPARSGAGCPIIGPADGPYRRPTAAVRDCDRPPAVRAASLGRPGSGREGIG